MDSPDFFAECQVKGFDSLRYAALDCVAQQWGVKCIIISNECLRVESGDITIAAKTPAIALSKVLPQEIAGCTAVFVDLDVDLATRHLEWLFDSLLGDLESKERTTIIAYRGKQRWLQVYQARDIVRTKPIFRRGGTYLITGGAGAVGMLLAEHLALRFGARLVLTGRTSPTAYPEFEAALQRIRACGGDALFCQADVADESAMRGAVSQCLARFGDLNGIVHAAGVTHGASLFCLSKDITPDDCETQIKPKLFGLYVIEKLSHELKLDFVVAMSSNAAVLGGLGFLAYAAANCAMDSYLTSARFDDSTTQWLSINWDHWPEQTQKYVGMRTSMHEFAMTLSEAVEAFEWVLSCSDSGQIVVSTGYLPDRVELWLGARRADHGVKDAVALPTSGHSSRPRLRSSYVEPRNNTEATCAEIWSDVLGLDKVGVDDDFFELGGHSLVALTLINKLQDVMRVDVPLQALFEGPTVAQMSRVIASLKTHELE
jgi:short-subunit dehydrogenase involved in D-alanine esterification of teichoic acids/acyl carrier protein